MSNKNSPDLFDGVVKTFWAFTLIVCYSIQLVLLGVIGLCLDVLIYCKRN
jgi:hypothetical protein